MPLVSLLQEISLFILGLGRMPLGFGVPYFTLRLLRESWVFRGRVSALGARVPDLTTRVQEP